MNSKLTATCTVMFVLFLLSGMAVVHSAPVLDINMETDMQIYDVGDFVYIKGNLTNNNVSAYDALVGIEILSPSMVTFVVRTLKTGPGAGSFPKVSITDLHMADSHGEPQTLFHRGGTAYIAMNVTNTDTLIHHVKIAFYIQYSDYSAFRAWYPFETDIQPGVEMRFVESVPIPSSAVTGRATVFASVFSDTPEHGGAPYCSEAVTPFDIDSTTPVPPPQPQNAFNMSFKLPKYDVKLGNYTIYARSDYLDQLATDIKEFKVILLADVTGPTMGVPDGKVDMRDIGRFSGLYGVIIGNPNYDPKCDITGPVHRVPDGVIDMRDIGVACGDFGNTAIP